MKPFAFALALLTPAMVHAACTGDLPGRSALEVFNATTGDGVIGGIGPRQCGLEVTDFCGNGRCLAFYNGLSGYIDVTGLQSGTIEPAPADFIYNVARADGDIQFLGNAQPFEFGPGTALRVEPAADHVRLFLPQPFPQPIEMTSTGSTGWEAILPNWIGVPVPVILYLDQLSAPKARLELQADHTMLNMDVILHLERVSGPNLTEASADQGDPAGGQSPDACAEADRMAQLITSADHPDLNGALFNAIGRAGITDWQSRSQEQCRELLRHLDAMDIRAETISPGPAATSEPASPTVDCATLSERVRPVLRGAPSAEKSVLLEAMLNAGVTSLTQADETQCAEIAKAIQ